MGLWILRGTRHDGLPTLDTTSAWKTRRKVVAFWLGIVSDMMMHPFLSVITPTGGSDSLSTVPDASLDTFDIYTDAALSDGQACIAWICAQTTEYTGTYRCQLPNGTPLHAELLVIWGANASLPYTIQKPLRVFTDSYAAYSEIFRPASEDATAAAIQSILRRHEKADRPIEIIWTPGHTGVPGGNTAAHAAAASAGGFTNLSLPPPLRINPYELLSQMAPSVATMHYVRTSLRAALPRRPSPLTVAMFRI
ncbi:hypothetical protein HPB52_008295 [Rhipicephalus sanguineus]|uniref:RNase H type-1 domain-containing protein n=1 Tax=Rhipicephalus sanguineus TaxID=34632 RepID=A0A9D4PWA8_RHISA|nr:hypothetical protein HPB52_008295 [Rhipicephalus sanguineus]